MIYGKTWRVLNSKDNVSQPKLKSEPRMPTQERKKNRIRQVHVEGHVSEQ